MRWHNTCVRSLQVAVAAALLLAGGATAAHIKLFVLTGQSNSLGTTAGGESDPSPGADPADTHIRFFWHNVADATTSLGDSGGVFTPLREQQGGYYPGSATHWGPEIAFGRTLYRAGMRDFGIVKASRGGGGNTNWSKTEGGHMYTLVTSTVAEAVANLTASGHTCEVTGLLYLQGESDSATEAAIASNRLATLVANLRTDLPHATNLFAVIGGIAAAGATRDIVRVQQANLAAGDPAIDTFGTLDLQSQLYDALHFDKAAKLEVGARYAQAFLSAGAVARNYGALAFIGDSITQGGYGHPSYRYEVFKQLATNNASFSFAGSVTGAYAWSAVSTPDWNGHAFTNAHDGHFGWRASWVCARTPLPSGRYNVNNLGSGTLLNWTGQSATYVTADAGTLAYTGATYSPDTAVIMIGINDLGDGVSTNQVAEDVSAMVRQLQAARPEVTVYLASVTHVGAGHAQYPALNATIDACNARLSQIAPSWSTSGSAVFFIDVTSGYDATGMTYDNVHPNAFGEAFIGRRIAAALGLPVPASVTPKDSADFANRFTGNLIWNGSGWTNGWAEGGSGTESLSAVDDFRFKASGSGEFISGEGEDGSGGLNWSNGYGSNWTIEVRMKIHDAPNGVALWAGEGENKPVTIVTIYNDHTTSSAGRFYDSSINNDGQYHIFRVAYEAEPNLYHVWRDGVRLTAAEGVAADQASNTNGEWLFIGDYTSAVFGDDFDISVDDVRYDLSGAYAPDRHARCVPVTFTGYAGTSALTNFPILVAFGTNMAGFNYATFTSSQGYDLRFRDATQTQLLDYEIDTWNPDGLSLAWVRLPQLAGTDTRIFACWGDDFADTPPACTTNGAVWSGTYHTVLHLSGTDDGGRFPDATATAKPFVNLGGTNVAPGVVGRAQGFGPAAYCRSAATNLIAASYSNICYSGWYRTSPGGGWVFSHQGANVFIENAGKPMPFFDGSSAGSSSFGTGFNNGAWHHFAMQNNGSLTQVYLDGVFKGSQSETLNTSLYGRATTLAANFDGSNHFSGDFDEFRIALNTFPADWHQASFSNQASSATFATPGPIQCITAQAPSVTTGAGATSVGSASATLNGDVLAGYPPPQVSFQWWPDGGPTSTVDKGVMSGAFSSVITGLAARHTYYYRCVAANSAGESSTPPVSFTTDFIPPTLTDVFVGNDGHYPVYRIQAVQTTLSGALLAFAEGRASISDQAQNDIVLKRSFDGGDTWGALQILHDDGANSLNNPCVVQDALTGRIILFYQRYPYGLNEGSVVSGYTGNNICRSFLMTSDDDGATWSAPADITSQVKPPAPADSIASGPGAGIQLRHPGADGVPGTADDHAGRLIMPFNHGEAGSVWKLYAAYSDDHGATWAYGADADSSQSSGYGNEVQMVELSDGRVMLNARAQGGLKYRKVAASSDGGLTWTPLDYDTELIEPTCCASVFRLTDPLDGQANRILYAGPYSQSSRVNGNVHLSTDDGDTWPTRREIYTGSYAYSTLTVLADGHIGCLFERDNYTRISFSRFTLNWLSAGADTFEGGYPRITVYAGAGGITSTSALLRATLTTAGTAATTVFAHWGTADGGANTSGWEHACELGVSGAALPASYSFPVSGLTPDTAYVYRYRAVNAHGTVWSEKGLFKTYDGNGITATNGPGVTALAVGSATLNGGADEAGELRLYFGASDGGDSADAWDTHYTFALSGPGSASNTVTGLLYGVRYYYRAYATNALKESWASGTCAFTTPRAPITSSQSANNNYGNYAGQSVVIGDPSAAVTKSMPVARMPQAVALKAFSFWRQTGNEGTDGPLYLNVYSGTNWSRDFVGTSTNTVNFRALADGQKGTWLFDALRLNTETEFLFMASATPTAGSLATIRIRAQSGSPAAGNLKDLAGGTASANYDARYEAECELPIRLSNAAATAGGRHALLSATLTDLASVYDVCLYWNRDDGGTNPAVWVNARPVGRFTNALDMALSCRVDGLSPDRAYHYTFRATNAVDDLWAPASATFETAVGTRFFLR